MHWAQCGNKFRFQNEFDVLAVIQLPAITSCRVETGQWSAAHLNRTERPIDPTRKAIAPVTATAVRGAIVFIESGSRLRVVVCRNYDPSAASGSVVVVMAAAGLRQPAAHHVADGEKDDVEPCPVGPEVVLMRVGGADEERCE